MNSVRFNNLSLKYQRFTPSGIVKIKKFLIEAKTHFLVFTNGNHCILTQRKIFVDFC